MILGEVLGSDAPNLPGTHLAVALARLDYKEEGQSVELAMWPADTLQQARVFYKRLESTDRILSLTTEGWEVWPNFHFGFMTTGYCWTKTTISVAEYVSYWRENIDSAVQIPRRDWDRYWDELVGANIAQKAERQIFDSEFTNTRKSVAAPRPGLSCVFSWSLDEAERLDSSGKFTRAVKERINQLLHALGEESSQLDTA